jgi:hypothetical protein
MPAWSGLLWRLLRKAEKSSTLFPDLGQRKAVLKSCRAALAKERFGYAATLIRRLLTTAELRDAVRECFGGQVLAGASPALRSQMQRRLAALLNIPFAGVITTNYDATIEEHIPVYAKRAFVQVSGGADRLGSILYESHFQQSFFVKLHGSLDSEIVLSTEEYDRVYLGDARVRTFLTAAMLRYSFLFVGASLEDELVRIRRRLMLTYSGDVPPAYAIFPRNEENETRAEWLQNALNITSLLYESRSGVHSELDDILDAMAQGAERQIQMDMGFRPSSTIKELAKLTLRQRLQKIGAKNALIVQYVRGLSGKRIEHAAVTQLAGDVDPGVPPELAAMSADELVYRVLFLVSVGLLSEVEEGGKLFYQISKG